MGNQSHREARLLNNKDTLSSEKQKGFEEVKYVPLIIKINIIGYEKCGKTSLLNRYIMNTFTHDTFPTSGSQTQTKQLIDDSGMQTEVTIWDNSGQAKYFKTISIFIKGSDAVILMYSITDSDSFEDVRRWYNYVKTVDSVDTPIILVGNKTDLDLDQGRKVLYDDGDKLAKELKIPFMEISCKDNNNVDELFEIIIELAFEFNQRKQKKIRNERQKDDNDNNNHHHKRSKKK